MGAIANYFAAIGRAIATIGDGLAVTGSYMLRKPITIQYPDRTAEPLVAMLPERSRGMLEVDLDLCTGCVACQRACPLACISIDVSKGKDRVINEFTIDLAKCMHCGLCTEACPSSGIRHSHEFEGGVGAIDNLVIDFVETPRSVAKPVKKGDPEPPQKPLGSILLKFLPKAWDPKRPRVPVAVKVASAAAAAPAAAAPAAPEAAAPAAAAPIATPAPAPAQGPAAEAPKAEAAVAVADAGKSTSGGQGA